MEEETDQETIISYNEIRLGEIILISNTSNIEELIGFAKALLDDQAVKEYLGLLNSKKKTGDYVG